MTNNKRKMPTFKAGDRVGRYETSHTNPVIFEKEQVLDIPEPKFEPKKGQLCLFWDGSKTNKIILSRFQGARSSGGYYSEYWISYQNCAPFNGELPEGVEL